MSWLRVDVIDEGPGLSAEQAACLFQPFAQLPSSQSACGSGLGLLLCKQLIELLGGVVGVGSESDADAYRVASMSETAAAAL